MIELELIELFKKGILELDISLSEEMIKKCFRYKALVLDWNQRLNLTAIEDGSEFIIKHFLDSLTVVHYLKEEKKSLIDIGTGAGFPGIPLKIIFPQLKVTLLDSLDKRIKFLNAVITELGLREIDSIHFRAEDAGSTKTYREKFDYAIARAVAPLPVLLEYCLPFVNLGGTFLAMKGLSENEVQGSKKALSALGGEIQEIKSFQLPFTDNQRNIIVIKKFRQTPTQYPRKAGIPSKNPL